MRRKLGCLAALAIFAEATSAYPIGRIGNSARVGDSKDLYSMPVPANFASISALVSDDAVILDSGLYASLPPSPVDIQVLPIRTQYPQFIDMSRVDVRDFFLKSSGIVYSELPTANGALSMIGESKSALVGLSLCKELRGYVLLAKNLTMTKTAMTEILTKTEYDGPCAK